MDEIFSRQFAMPQPKPQAGMFGGGKPDWTSAVQAAIGGWLAGGGAPGGQQILSQLHQRQMMAQQQAMEDQQYQRQRTDGMQDWIARQEYEQAHQGPDPLAQMMMQAGIDPNSPQGRQMYGQALQNKVNPFVQMRVQNPEDRKSVV